MTQHNIIVEIYMGVSKSPINIWDPVLSTTDTEIDKYGSIWGEREVLQLGAHFNTYRRYKKGRSIRNRISVQKLPGMPSEYMSTPNKRILSIIAGRVRAGADEIQ
jgi:hypothetical protein